MLRQQRATHMLLLFFSLILKSSYSWSPSKRAETFRMNTNGIVPAFPTSTETGLTNTDAPQNSQHKHWHVWKAADRLEKDGLSSPLPSKDTEDLIQKVVPILHQWGETWAGEKEWQGLLNKPSLLHEIEESIIALHSLIEWMNKNQDIGNEPITVVDVCCGKGIFSMLASYIFQDDSRIHQIVMLDKASIKWNHVDVANTSASAERRPKIELWYNCNLHEVDDVVNRLEGLQTPLALVGIHLCKTLSPTLVGIANAIGPSRCPFLCLAPCCLPRAVISQSTKYKKAGNPIIEVLQYESPQQRDKRFNAIQRRKLAMNRGQPSECYLCQSVDHPINKCGLLPTNEKERKEILYNAAPCWKCGEPGHNKANCPSKQTSGKPSLVQPPVVRMNVSKVLNSERPFDTYCDLLTETLQRDHVRLVETGLVNDKTQHDFNRMNWNRGRKSIYIIATQ